MNILLEILLVALLIKTMGLSAVIIWTLYVVSKILGQLYIMWKEGLKQVFLIHYKKRAKKR